MSTNKVSRRNKGLSTVVDELSRRGYKAVLQGQANPPVDIICYDPQKTKSVNLIVRTYNPAKKSCIVGLKAEKFFGDNFFWILAGIPLCDSSDHTEFYIIPNRVMAENVPKFHRLWLETPGRFGRIHQDNNVRIVLLSPNNSPYYWDVSSYRNNWDFIREKFN